MNLAPLSGLIPAEALICQGMGLLFNLAEFKGRTMKEIWKDIPKYLGYYQASNLGRVKSLTHKTKQGKEYKGKVLKKNINKSGYEHVNLSMNSVVKNMRVHRLVMLAFVGESDNQVDHIDGIRTNNVLGNLRYVTQSENEESKHKRLGRKLPKGIYKDRGKYKACLTKSETKSGKPKSIGRFETINQAIDKRNQYLKRETKK